MVSVHALDDDDAECGTHGRERPPEKLRVAEGVHQRAGLPRLSSIRIARLSIFPEAAIVKISLNRSTPAALHVFLLFEFVPDHI